MDQNLSGYKIFYEVATCGNISKAAKKLYISQPAISKSIVKLEDGLDTALSPEFPRCNADRGRHCSLSVYKGCL